MSNQIHGGGWIIHLNETQSPIQLVPEALSFPGRKTAGV
jgi:hypothetical protein